MKNYLKFFVLLALILGGHSIAFSQKSQCEEYLEIAINEFEAGRPEKIAPLLDDCVQKSVLNKQNRITALRLMTISYLLEQEDSLADVTFRQLLKLDPLHEVETDLDGSRADFLTLYESYRTDPRYFISAQVGGNFVQPQIIQSRSIGSSNLNYLINAAIQTGVNFSKPIKGRNWRINIGAHYAIYEFELLDNLSTGFGQPKQVRLFEHQRLFQLPLGVSYNWEKRSKYAFEFKQIFPYVTAGVRADYLFRAEYLESRRDNIVSSSQVGLDQSNILDLRQQLQIAAYMGGGVKMKVDRFHFYLDAIYSFWPYNMVKQPYGNHELSYLYGYVDNDLRLHHFAINIGFEIPIYRHKRIKSSRSNLSNSKQ